MSNMLVIKVKGTPKRIVIEDGAGNPVAGELDIPASGWCGQVKTLDAAGRKVDYVKYDVRVTGHGPALDLDPVIIIDR
jgi:hypothetical protein